MLYDLEYLPVARRDMLEITEYISQKLNNPAAAERLITALVEKAESLGYAFLCFPMCKELT
jgi:plasmid stabilization system protein ParE